MKTWGSQPLLWGLVALATIWMLVVVPLSAAAAPYAGYVIDARNGKVLYSENANTRLHPASLTKMMTLYIVFEAVENGEIGLDDVVTISRTATAEPPSKLGLRPGQRIRLRYLIRAAAVRSANDAATALAEAIEGSEARFARRMNRTAKAMGMTRTTFKNAHGLTESGHLSTARDMTLLGRQVFFDYPEYYNLFSRLTADAQVKTVRHTNRRFLSSYRGADGIKTGYTRAAGFNLWPAPSGAESASSPRCSAANRPRRATRRWSSCWSWAFARRGGGSPSPSRAPALPRQAWPCAGDHRRRRGAARLCRKDRPACRRRRRAPEPAAPPPARGRAGGDGGTGAPCRCRGDRARAQAAADADAGGLAPEQDIAALRPAPRPEMARGLLSRQR